MENITFINYELRILNYELVAQAQLIIMELKIQN
jgi:hypothetical protein